ncbi:uncharacterized protein [Macrobrachium rosenbergii]|uniref:uncharacterized protein n=1 Tax=Macrobrachium rosenbergii TaxID=79674 RepID=UPI0034D6893B
MGEPIATHRSGCTYGQDGWRKDSKKRHNHEHRKTCLKEGLLPSYTSLRLHDPTAQREPGTRSFRRTLLQRQLSSKERERATLVEEKKNLYSEWANFRRRSSNPEAAHSSASEEDETASNTLQGRGHCSDIIECLRRLEEKDAEKKMRTITKKLIALNGGKLLSSINIIDRRLREAAKQLREREDITVRRADKTAAFVLINTEDYHRKLDDILADSTKFQRITKNPVDEIRREANRIIETVNAASNALHLPPITGDYDLGYVYGNVKTHKQGNPLRPIISQIPAPTYQLAKRLNTILTPYVPSSHSLKSSAEFLEALRAAPPGGCIASMDVESLFTNVPVDETIQMILDRVYRDPTTPSLNIPEHALRALLEICTKKAPFSNHRGHMYTQIDGVAMGSPSESSSPISIWALWAKGIQRNRQPRMSRALHRRHLRQRQFARGDRKPEACIPQP